MNHAFATDALRAPATTDHAFAAPQGRLQAALAPFARRASVGLVADTPGLSHPLVAFVEGPTLTGIDALGVLHGIPGGSRLLACSASPRAGRVQLLVRTPAATLRLDVYGDVLQAAFTACGQTLLEVLETRLAGLSGR